MAVAPKFTSHILSATPPQPTHTLELYLDYVCPFSAKLLLTLHTHILPLLPSYPTLRLILRHQIQPWHPSSTLTHEAALAVSRLSPTSLLPYSIALMQHQREYFDVVLANEGRNDTYKRLAALAEETVGVSKEEVYELLKIPEEAGEDGALNVGNKVTDDLKVHIKAARLVGVHVSPTVIFNGVVENAISSGWTKEQWAEWLGKNVV
ncbi:hypothetical protein BDD12DRAFT_60409 [Trichophaea hybrida]|nr:hypothetical protein BDD12DRAFT_60409 [Trichophaea hybrida]